MEEAAMNVTALPNQTLLDIAIQEYGDLAGVFFLARDNDISPTEKLTPGMTVSVPDVVINREMQEYCKANNVSPATSETSLSISALSCAALISSFTICSISSNVV